MIAVLHAFDEEQDPDPDPHVSEKPDPDPHLNFADPQPWYRVTICCRYISKELRPWPLMRIWN